MSAQTGEKSRSGDRVQTLVSLLRDGYTLENRGTGWFLASPRIPYRRSKIEQVDDAIVNQMERDGIIEITIPYASAKARLLTS